MLRREGLTALLTAALIATPVTSAAAELSTGSSDKHRLLAPADKPDSSDRLPLTTRRADGPATDALRQAVSSMLSGAAQRTTNSLQVQGGTFTLTSGDRLATSATTAAAPATTPAITEPTEGATVAGTVTVTVTSSAPVVRIAVPALGLSDDVPVVDGVAQTQFESYGLHGARAITAADCDETAACGTPSTVNVTVANAAPTLTKPSAGAVVSTSFWAAGTTPGGSVAFLIDGVKKSTDAEAPFEQQLYTDGLSTGTHTVRVVTCNSAGNVCATGNPSEPVSIMVKHRLSPSVSSVLPSPFSPGADGRKDVATVTYSLETAQVVRWRVTNAAGTTVVGPRSLGGKSAGTHRFTFNGKNNSGSYLPTGRYAVHLDTTKAITDGTLQGHAQRAVAIDRTRPAATNIAAAPATVFPIRDGYKDTTALRARLSERVAWLRVEIVNSRGRLVRTLSTGAKPAGPVSVTWNGRRGDGSMVPAGSYRFRFAMQDVAGNRTTTARYGVTVSDKRLVGKQGKKTVTARGSLVSGIVGVCSDLFSPGLREWPGSIGYYSDVYDCATYDGDDLAAAIHGVTLPPAIKYGSVRVETFGGKAVPDYNDVAAIVYLTGKGELSDRGRTLYAAVKTYAGPTVGPRFVSGARRVRWLVGTIDQNWYDVKTYTVHFTYFVLQ